MFKTSKEFEAAMYDILMQIRDNPNDRNVLSKLGDINFDDALAKCIEFNYVKGLNPRYVASGNLNIDIIGEIRISYEGLKFLENFKA